MKIYYCKTDEFQDLAGLNLLSENRRARVERYRMVSSKAECLIAGLLLRMVFGSDYENRLLTGEHGKPQFRNGTSRFNLSHSGNYVVLAVAECELGVDIEKIEQYNWKVAERCCTANEKEWLKQQNTNSAFYHIWTGKEAVMKAVGLGFSMNPQSFDLLPLQNGPHEIHKKIWYLNWHLLDEHQICVASEKKEEIEFIPVNKKELLI